MIKAIGIDSVDIHRFATFNSWPRRQLARLFSEQEIDYCLSIPVKSPERFAVRFAAKEAFYKAIHHILPGQKFPLLAVCKNMSVIREANGTISLEINENYFGLPKEIATFISLTHTKITATAIVILESKSKENL